MTRPRRLLTAAALAFALSSTSCATTGTTGGEPPPSPVVGGVINCAEAGVHEAALGLLDDVASALATGDYMSALGDLVKRFGEGAIDCGVREVAEKSERRAMYDKLDADKGARARTWLASRPVTLSMIEGGMGGAAVFADGRLAMCYSTFPETCEATPYRLSPAIMTGGCLLAADDRTGAIRCR